MTSLALDYFGGLSIALFTALFLLAVLAIGIAIFAAAQRCVWLQPGKNGR